MELKIVGTQFKSRESQALFKAATDGTTVIFARDPLNPYDSNAVKVLMLQAGTTALKDVGFVAKEQAAELQMSWPADSNLQQGVLIGKKLAKITGPASIDDMKALQKKLDDGVVAIDASAAPAATASTEVPKSVSTLPKLPDWLK